MIEAVYLDEGELISAGADGYVRVRDYLIIIMGTSISTVCYHVLG